MIVLWDQLTFRCSAPQSIFSWWASTFACCTEFTCPAGKTHAAATTIYIKAFEFHILECQGITFHSINIKKNPYHCNTWSYISTFLFWGLIRRSSNFFFCSKIVSNLLVGCLGTLTQIYKINCLNSIMYFLKIKSVFGNKSTFNPRKGFRRYLEQ